MTYHPPSEYEPTMELRWKRQGGTWDNPSPRGHTDIDGNGYVLQQKYVHPETDDEIWRDISVER